MVNKVSKISKNTSSMGPAAKQSYTMGFTLIEVMIVVALIAIIAAIAYPSFLDSVRKSRRADAQQGLMQAAQKLENFYARNAAYTEDLTQVGYANAGWNDLSAGSNTVYYQMQVTPGGCNIANCFILQAEPKAGTDQEKDSVCLFTLRSTGLKQINLKRPSETTCPGGITKNGWK